MEVLHNSQKFRVGTPMLYPYPYQYPDNFTRAYPYPGYCATGVQNCISSGYGMNVVEILPTFWYG